MFESSSILNVAFNATLLAIKNDNGYIVIIIMNQFSLNSVEKSMLM